MHPILFGGLQGDKAGPATQAARKDAIDRATDALKALEENITDEMVWAARGTGDMAEMMVDKEVRKVFTAMLRAAREEYPVTYIKHTVSWRFWAFGYHWYSPNPSRVHDVLCVGIGPLRLHFLK